MRTFLLCVMGVLLAACWQGVSKTDVSAVSAFEGYVTAINAGNIVAAASYYDASDGFHWVERGHIQYETGEDAANSLKALQAGGGQPKMMLDNMRVAQLSNDAALISAHFDFEMLTDTGDTQFSFDGWMTVGMVRRADGWKIAGGQTGPGRSK